MNGTDSRVTRDEFDRLSDRVASLETVVRQVIDADRNQIGVGPFGRGSPPEANGILELYPSLSDEPLSGVTIPEPPPAPGSVASPPAVPSAVGPRHGGAASSTGVSIAAAKGRSTTWEQRVGAHWADKAGALLVLLGISFFVKFAFDQGWVSPAMRVGAGVLLGLALAAVGEAAHRRGLRSYAHALSSTGTASVYLSLYAGASLYGFFGQTMAIGMLAVVSALGAALALRYDAQPLALMTAVGAYLAPVLISGGGAEGGTNPLFMGYLAVVTAGYALLAISRTWSGVQLLAFCAVWLLSLIAIVLAGHADDLVTRLAYLTVYYLELLTVSVALRLREAAAVGDTAGDGATRTSDSVPRRQDRRDLVLLLANPAIFYVMVYCLFQANGRLADGWMAGLAFGLAALYAYIATLPGGADPLLSGASIAVAAAFLTTGLAFGASSWTTLAWCAESLALAWTGFRYRIPLLRSAGRVILAMATFRAFIADLPDMDPTGMTPFLNVRFLTLALVAASLGASAWMDRAHKEPLRFPHLSLLAAHFCLLYALSLEVCFLVERLFGGGAAVDATAVEGAQQFALTALWATYAVVMLAMGFVRDLSGLRVAGLGLLAAVVVKLLFFDLANVETAWRIASFMGIGALLLSVSLAYHHRKVG